MTSFTKATEKHHFLAVETLANSIWNEHYTAIIGKPQVEYMLKTFQSYHAIVEQIKGGYQYFLIEQNTTQIGYLSIKKEDKNLFLSKLYLLKSQRGKGFGKQALNFIDTKAKDLGCETISLTVNKNNINSIKAYQNIGFKNIGAIIIDIGNGFIMDDFKMMKSLH